MSESRRAVRETSTGRQKGEVDSAVEVDAIMKLDKLRRLECIKRICYTGLCSE